MRRKLGYACRQRYRIKKQIRSDSDLLSNKSRFGGQLWSRSYHEHRARVIRVIHLLTTDRQTVIHYSVVYFWSWAISIPTRKKGWKYATLHTNSPSHQSCRRQIPRTLTDCDLKFSIFWRASLVQKEIQPDITSQKRNKIFKVTSKRHQLLTRGSNRNFEFVGCLPLSR